MKKLFSVIMACTLLLSLTACKNNENFNKDKDLSAETDISSKESVQAGDTEPAEPGESTNKELVVYFSATGNTESVAEVLAQMQEADLYKITPEQPYTDDDLNYGDETTRATVEQNDKNARPAISGGIDNIEKYDVIYLGTPIWWGDMPRILYTFFDTYDLSGKTIAPFCTSGGSGVAEIVETIEGLEPSATITEGLRTSASNAEGDITQWLRNISLAE
ncbi:flavodoxin [Luxibacter massiliensis]|uniref:flavodoxin n=1 Tax=Luxibacter massiliensis TaxID=2219695 RepID=UPI000F0533B6|nr:flavodoxin [Luxibacter massiliensis]